MIVKYTNFINNLTFVAGIHQIFTSSLTHSHNILSVPLAPSVMAYHPTVTTTRQIMRTRILQRAAVSSTNSNNNNNNINGIQKTRNGAAGEPFSWTGRGYHHRHHYPYRKNILLLDDRVSSTTTSTTTSTRLFRSNPNRRGNDDEKNDNKVTGKLQQWASKAAKKVKSILPKSWTSSSSSSSTLRRQRQQEQQQQQQQQQQQDISSSLDSLFRDSPLGIRLMGNMIVKPLISSLAGSLAQTMQEQQREMSDLLEEARTLILYDENLVASLGGEPIQVSPPFSQSSSSSAVSTSGGRMEKQSRVEASFQVTGGRGSYGSGVATMVAVNGTMERLYVNVQGRYYEVNVEGGTRGASSSRVVVVEEEDGYDVFGARKKTRGTAPSSSSSRNGGIGKNHNQGRGGKDDIIDAEFVDKKVFKR